jgi:IS5 family transposase
MDRCWLQGALGDALHATSCAAGYDLRWLLRAIARLGIGSSIFASVERGTVAGLGHTCLTGHSWPSIGTLFAGMSTARATTSHRVALGR